MLIEILLLAWNGIPDCSFAWIGAAIAGGAAILGGIMNNQANAQQSAADRRFQHNEAQNQMAFQNLQARRQEEFQTLMSNTAYQRSMEDMKKAGLNPMLAFSQGSASTPSGSAPSGGYASSIS